MFALGSDGCSFGSMPPTGSSSWSRIGAVLSAADDAARAVLRLDAAVPVALARSLLDEAIRADARLRWAGDLVALAPAASDALLLEEATFVVFDLETTGLRPATARPCEVGAVRVEHLALDRPVPVAREPRRAAPARRRRR